MRVGLFTKEFPPEVYGGAGVHVDYLCRELAKEIAVEATSTPLDSASSGRTSVQEMWQHVFMPTERHCAFKLARR